MLDFSFPFILHFLLFYSYDVMYPQNEIESWYKDMLKADGLDGDLKSPVRYHVLF